MLTIDDAFLRLADLGAPPRLVTYARLVLEAGELLLTQLAQLRVPLDAGFVRAGIVLYDVGKAVHPADLDGAGARHEDDGERAVLAAGVEPRLARVGRSRAHWVAIDNVAFEEVLVALADALWKGARSPALEARVIDGVAARLGHGRWDVFVALDEAFERIASDGDDRLERSRCSGRPPAAARGMGVSRWSAAVVAPSDVRIAWPCRTDHARGARVATDPRRLPRAFPRDSPARTARAPARSCPRGRRVRRRPSEPRASRCARCDAPRHA